MTTSHAHHMPNIRLAQDFRSLALTITDGVFSLADVDGDGQLSWDEFKSNFKPKELTKVLRNVESLTGSRITASDSSQESLRSASRAPGFTALAALACRRTRFGETPSTRCSSRRSK